MDPELENLLAVAGAYDDDDEVGADYVGDDYDYGEVGARRGRPRLKRMPKIARYAQARNMPAIFLGFREVITASTTETVTSEANVKLRPTDLIVRDSNASDFLFTSIRIGRVDLIAGSVAIPADAFTSGVQSPPISSPVLEAGTQSSIGVENLTAADSLFSAMFTALDISKHPVSP